MVNDIVSGALERVMIHACTGRLARRVEARANGFRIM